MREGLQSGVYGGTMVFCRLGCGAGFRLWKGTGYEQVHALDVDGRAGGCGLGRFAHAGHRAMILALHRLCGNGRGKGQRRHARKKQSGVVHAASPRGRTLTTRIIPACM